MKHSFKKLTLSLLSLLQISSITFTSYAVPKGNSQMKKIRSEPVLESEKQVSNLENQKFENTKDIPLFIEKEDVDTIDQKKEKEEKPKESDLEQKSTNENLSEKENPSLQNQNTESQINGYSFNEQEENIDEVNLPEQTLEIENQGFKDEFPNLRDKYFEEQSEQISTRARKNKKRRKDNSSRSLNEDIVNSRNSHESSILDERIALLESKIVSKSAITSFYIDPDDLVPDEILKSPKNIIINRIKSKKIKLTVSAPSIIEQTPGEFSIDVNLENMSDSVLEDISIGIAFYNDAELSLVPPVPAVKGINLLHNKNFSFNVSVDQINTQNKRSSFCIYVYSYGSDGIRDDIPYLISSYTKQIQLTQSPPKKAIIVVPGICGSELFSNSAQVINGAQYSKEYRIWPPEGAMHIVDSGVACAACTTIGTDSARLLDDFSLVAYDENGISKADVMPINPILDCRTNPENRTFGAANAYGDLIEKLKTSRFLQDYQIVLFSYDWRLDNATTADLLNNFIQEQRFSDVTLIGHSMGGLVCSSLMTKCFDPRKINKIILLGAPLQGAAKSFASMQNGVFFDGLVGLSLGPVTNPFVKNIARNCIATYELVPPRQAFKSVDDGYVYERNANCGCSIISRYDVDDYDQTIELIKITHPTNKAEEYFEIAQQFHDSLYDAQGNFVLNDSNLNVYNIVGFNTKTAKGFYVKLKFKHHKTKCTLDDILGNGDGTVTLSSSTAGFTFPLEKTYFAKNVSHLGLVSNEDCLDLVVNIISNRPEVFDPYVIQKFEPTEEVTCNGCIPPVFSVLKKL